MAGHPFREASATATKLASTKLEPGSSRVKDFLTIGAFAIVWNTISGLIFAAALLDGETVFAVISGLFVLVGLGLLAYAAYRFLAIFNPTIELHVSTHLPALGDTLDVRWKVSGSASRIRALKIELLGIERTTYRRGTDTTTDTHEFERIRIAHTDDAREIAAGTGSVEVPAGGVPSFIASDNQIMWVIRIEGDIPRWPDLRDMFAIDVVANQHHRKQREAA